MFSFYTNAIDALKGRAMSSLNGIINIEWAPAEAHRIRKIVKRSNHRVTGKFPSWKMKRMMQWESTLERDAFYLLDANPNVIEFHEQPAKISYTLGGEDHCHYPDIFVKTSHDSSFIEVKESKDAADELVTERTEFLSFQLPVRGFSYGVLTEDEIRQEPRLSNSRRLVRYGRKEVPIQIRDMLIRNYFMKGECPTSQIINSNDCNILYPAICRMILEGALSIDLSQEWTAETPLIYTETKEVL